MSKNENKYKVTSPIRYNGKRYNVDDHILLEEEVAEGLHVELADGTAEETKEELKSPSLEFETAKEAVKHIEETDFEKLQGFVVEPHETRKTVLKAWEKKISEASEETSEEE